MIFNGPHCRMQYVVHVLRLSFSILLLLSIAAHPGTLFFHVVSGAERSYYLCLVCDSDMQIACTLGIRVSDDSLSLPGYRYSFFCNQGEHSLFSFTLCF